jgi:hypothetical protein
MACGCFETLITPITEFVAVDHADVGAASVGDLDPLGPRQQGGDERNQ